MTKAKTLYVCRPLLAESASSFLDWAAREGFATTLKPEDLHVTIAYSREPLEWPARDIGKLVIPPRIGARSVKRLGDEGAVVLAFTSAALQARWRQFRIAGASWDYPKYQPHLTITYDAGGVNPSRVAPFVGELRFGPEQFEELDDDKAKPDEVAA